MELTELQLNKIKELELNMFDTIIHICEEEKIKYFVSGGTALGTIRHNGFIPWDDDIDIALPREDYEKFIKIVPEKLPENLFLQTFLSDPEYPLNYAKIRNSDTTFIESSFKDLKMNHGIYIDVFPLDGYPKSKLQQAIFNFRNNLLFYGCYFRLNRCTLSSVKTKLLYFTTKFLYKDIYTINLKREKLFKKYKYKDCEYVAAFCGAYGKKEIMPKMFFGNGRKGTFEGLTVNLPDKVEDYLTQLYGDFMQLPPIEKRKPHHHCVVVDLNKAYSFYK